MSRLAALAGFVALLCIGQAGLAQATDIPRWRGTIDRTTYPALAAELFKKSGKVVAFDATIPLDNDESKGHLTTFVLDGQFEIAWHAGRKGSKLYVDTGFDLVNDERYTLKGVFRVGAAEKDEDGIPTLYLETVEEPVGPSFRDIDLADLKTKG